MTRASYFMYDHHRNLPQIGDTDRTQLEEATVAGFDASGNSILDPEAGFGIFKDPDDSPASRYIAMRVQNQHHQPAFRHHCHNDVLSVYYARDGEVILSDQGRYSYSRTAIRGYVMSLAAHNTILPASMVVPKQPGLYVCEDVWGESRDKAVEFGAQLVNGVVKREVVIPVGEARFIVTDTIKAGDEYLLLWYLGSDVNDIKPSDPTTNDGMRYYEWALTTKKGATVKLQMSIQGANTSSGEEVALVKGQQNPMMGWYSPGYEELEPVPVITVLMRPVDEIKVTTEIRDIK